MIADEDPFGTPGVMLDVRPKRKSGMSDATVAGAYAGPIRFTIQGQPASKANSRQIVMLGGKPQLIKSKEARAYEAAALRQIPPVARLQLAMPVRVTLRIWYASELPDLDESIILDVLQNRYDRVQIPGKTEKQRILVQAGVYVNDRQVREKHVYHAIDKLMPRTDVLIEKLDAQEQLL